MRILRILIVPAALLLLVPAAQADTFTYMAGNHPDGNAAPPFYGLRLDFNGVKQTFNFLDVLFTYDDSTGMASLQGTIQHNQGTGNQALYQMMASFQISGGIFVGDPIQHLLNNGGFLLFGMSELWLTPLNAPGSYPGPLHWIGKSNNSDQEFLLKFGHRGFEGVSGFGWLQTCDDFNDPSTCAQTGTNDFLFTLHAVPEPGTTTLLGVGLAALAFFRRRVRFH